jgi:4-hydroxybenzoate polyprenyltransferase
VCLKICIEIIFCQSIGITLVEILYKSESKIMLGILWGLVVLLFAFWVLGLVLHIAGNLIHIALVLAITLAIYNFLKARDV